MSDNDKIFGFFDCDFLHLTDPTEPGWKKSDKQDYLKIIEESNFAILHKGTLKEKEDFSNAKPNAIFIRVSQGGQENLRKKRGFKPKDGVYCLHVWNQQPLENNPPDIKTKLLNELLNLNPEMAERIWEKNFDGLSDNLKLLFSMPGNSDILCCWWMLCQAYFLYEDEDDSKKEALLKDKDAWKLGFPDDEASAKDQVKKAKDQVKKAKDQVEKDIDYMCESRGMTISEANKNELKKKCKNFIDIVNVKFLSITDNALTELRQQLKILFPTQGGLK